MYLLGRTIYLTCTKSFSNDTKSYLSVDRFCGILFLIFSSNFLHVWGNLLCQIHWQYRWQSQTVWPNLAAVCLEQCDQIWQFVAILAIFGGVWRQFFCQKSPVHKSFDVDILGFGKFIYVLWRQIWRLLPKCWWLFGVNTWSHWFGGTGVWWMTWQFTIDSRVEIIKNPLKES